ncbi:MAG: isochorismatase family protein [Opitutae bacterium]|nr:isochorismatase family protein [Opitutae bacterium]
MPLGLAGLIVDLQPVFLDLVHESESFSSNCRFLIESLNLFQIPLFLTEQVPEKLGGTSSEFLSLAPMAPVFKKDTFSALGATGLLNALADDGIEHLLLAGVETSICVYLTALEALSSDLEVTILTDCVTCRRPSDGEWVLRKLELAGCHLLPVESIFYGILGGATHPLFRAFTKLVNNRGAK